MSYNNKYFDRKPGSLENAVLEALGGQINETNKNDKSDDGEGMDAVQPKAVKKKFDDRKDKDIDNDGDVDSSDEYLHKRRKAVSKAIKSEGKLDEGKMKELAGKIASVYKKMKSDSKMKPFADKFRADVKKSLDIRKSLEKVLPDYVGGGDITKLTELSQDLQEVTT